jgi:transcriptional regulator with XRE-family HTH domain
MCDSFGKRLAAERVRIGRTQEQLAALVRASKRSQIDWESGESSPKATYLMAMAREGIDGLTKEAGGHCSHIASGRSLA